MRQRAVAVDAGRLRLGTDVYAGNFWSTFVSHNNAYHFCSERCAVEWFGDYVRQALRISRRQTRPIH